VQLVDAAVRPAYVEVHALTLGTGRDHGCRHPHVDATLDPVA